MAFSDYYYVVFFVNQMPTYSQNIRLFTDTINHPPKWSCVQYIFWRRLQNSVTQKGTYQSESMHMDLWSPQLKLPLQERSKFPDFSTHVCPPKWSVLFIPCISLCVDCIGWGLYAFLLHTELHQPPPPIGEASLMVFVSGNQSMIEVEGKGQQGQVFLLICRAGLVVGGGGWVVMTQGASPIPSGGWKNHIFSMWRWTNFRNFFQLLVCGPQWPKDTISL